MDQPTTARRPRVPLPLALRVNSAVALVAAVVLLGATWRSLYDELDSFRPAPWIYAQLAGAGLLAFAYMTWRAARQPDASRLVVQGAAIMNVIGFICISVWLFSDDAGIPTSGSLGSWVFDVFAVVLLVLGIIETRAFRD